LNNHGDSQGPPKIYRDLRKYTQNSKTLPRLAKLYRNIKNYTGISKTTQEYQKTTQEYPKLHRNIKNYTGITKTTQEYPKIHTALTTTDLQNYAGLRNYRNHRSYK